MGLLSNKVAVITGAGRGIGRAVAMAIADVGAAVGLAARTADEIESAADQIRTGGGMALAVRTDVTQQKQVDALFAQVTNQLGQVDVLVNNAAIGSRTVGKLWETEPDDWLEMFDVNVIGMVRCTRAVLPSMIEKRCGKIIIVGSIAGRSEGWASRHHELLGYALSKAAANRFSDVLATQVKGYGINVNCIGVGAHTTINEPGIREQARRTGQSPPPTIEEIPEDRRIRPEENVAPFIFLASSLADHITGAYIEANMLPDEMRRRIARNGPIGD